MKKNILFITGTRADFGKLKSLINVVQNDAYFKCIIFCTGMHLLEKYGNTIVEIQKSGFSELIYPFINQVEGESMEIILSNTIAGLSRYVQEHNIDLIVIHGDRIEALAGAIVGALRNILVAHIEGGEVSGTIDDLLRHASSKMSHLHFVASKTAKKRLIQLGEDKKSIFQIGSPDIDLMLSDALPSIEEVKDRYEISFDEYSIGILHPVTTEREYTYKQAKIFVDAVLSTDHNFIIIYPNNDMGSEQIFDAYQEFKGKKRIKMYPSLRFEYFLTLLKYSKYIIGNSSTGIHEAPVYGVPTINIGSRQNNRFEYESIINVEFNHSQIQNAIDICLNKKKFKPTNHYGEGNSATEFIKILKKIDIWETRAQKTFKDI